MTKIGTKTMDVDHEDSQEPCKCHGEPIELRIHPWLDIHVRVPHGDERLVVLLYHNWVEPDTAYVVFDQVYRILGLYPPNPLLALLRWDEDED